jgi:hypothetical protein
MIEMLDRMCERTFKAREKARLARQPGEAAPKSGAAA